MIIKRDSALFSFAQLYKSNSICRNNSISLCELFWWTVHSLVVSMVLVAVLTFLCLGTGLSWGGPLLGITWNFAGALQILGWVDLSLAFLMGFSLWVVGVTALVLLVVSAFRLGQKIGKILPNLKPNIDPDKLSFLTVVPEYIVAKKRKICPIVQVK